MAALFRKLWTSGILDQRSLVNCLRSTIRCIYVTECIFRLLVLKLLRKRRPSLSFLLIFICGSWLVRHAKRFRRRLWDVLTLLMVAFWALWAYHEQSAFLAGHFVTPAIWIVLCLMQQAPFPKNKIGDPIGFLPSNPYLPLWIGLLRDHQNTSARAVTGVYRSPDIAKIE